MSRRQVRELIQEEFNSRSQKGLLAAISSGDLNNITKALDSSIKQELPRIVYNELRNLPLPNLVNNELEQRLLLLDQTLKSIQETFGTDSSDAKQDTPTTPQSTPETDITEPFNLANLLGEELVSLDFLISTLTNTRDRLLFVYKNVMVGAPGQAVPDNSASGERALNNEFFVARRQDIDNFIDRLNTNWAHELRMLEWTGDNL